MTSTRLGRTSRAVVGALLLIASASGCDAGALPPEGAGGAGSAAGAGGSPPAALIGATAQPSLAPGSGCGKPLPAGQPATVASKPTGYMQYTVTATGATLADPQPQKAGPRTFWVRVPVDYDPNHPYRVVYIGQGCGLSGQANTSTFQLYREDEGGTEQAIYVALDIPADMANMDCYDNNSGPASQEWEAFELIHSVVDANYCVDNDNVFIAGYSTGGWLANMWGCYFAGDGEHPWNGVPGGGEGASPRRFAPRYRVRGQALVDGNEPANNPPCNGPVASISFWTASGIPVGDKHAALTRVLRMNGCEGSPTAPWHPEIVGDGVCQQYTACPASTPVVYCEDEACHADDHGRAIPAFTRFWAELPPAP
jgi:poly(3-hydroxybutyrate) depolymerase